MKRRSIEKVSSRGTYSRKVKSPHLMMYGPRKHTETHTRRARPMQHQEPVELEVPDAVRHTSYLRMGYQSQA